MLSRIIGVIGEILITIGLILGLYVFWQLYWTSWQVSDNHPAAVAQFEKNLKPASEKPGEERYDDPPEFDRVKHGEVMGVLHNTKWNMQIPVVEGTDQRLLDLSYAGHYDTTQQPGELGNFAMAAHRRTYGNSFRRIDIMKPGDRMVFETPKAWLVYEVTDHEIVDPDAGEVLNPVPHQWDVQPKDRLMTLTTCHPEFGNSERYILYSKLHHWVPRDTGKPAELLGKAAK
ncbi:class E sortase [Gleimia hominis]|uniref:class E sortase n=1 Tax=Gleimia hominis TaxID=595468 RepID=UPI001E4F377F|nr:class E sortase [Gleimia hominis]WIK64202.1 class E sortase [Gleimia hominis]